MTTSGPVNSSSNCRQSSANAVADLFSHQCHGTLSCFGVGYTAAAKAIDLRFFVRLALDREYTSNSCLKFSAWNCRLAVRLTPIGLSCVVNCTIVLRVLLLTLLMLLLLATKLSSACSWLIEQFLLPSTLYLRSSDGSYSPSIHTP